MYWYKSPNTVALALSLLVSTCFLACKSDIKETGATLKYFDIKEYFRGDTARLNHENKPVLKTITYNGQTEQKTVHINNWGLELDSFIGSDINRPAWKNSYYITADSNFLVYRAKYPELKMQEMAIKKEKGKVKWILIYNKTKNIIYQTTQKLSYFPDSLYLIEQEQRVRLMGTNHYKVEGVINR
ncbi:MAG TPA: hypothetical protein VGN20_08160 [Mucilaginibacter sp.]|jgi:hypothetical protein